MAEAREFWDELFGPPAGTGSGVPLAMRLLRKGGKPFLLLPTQAKAAAAALELYPAQTARARLAKAAMRCLLRAGCPVGTQALTFPFAGEAPFPRFIRASDHAGSSELPCFGVLAGNPAMPSQRFLVLVFDARQQPVAVVKAGCNPAARQLIQKEAAFLASAADKSEAIPRVRARFQSEAVSALRLDYFAGHTPHPPEEGALPELLGGWVDTKSTTAIARLPDWIRLEAAAAANPSFSAIAPSLRSREIHPALYHGDFAPWNIKVGPAGKWRVLDWERGELAGLPGWDWFHYVLQTGILVERQPIPSLIERLEALLSSAAFTPYAARAGIAGLERPLVLAYLLQGVEVIQPSEGLPATRELLAALTTRWLKA
jgi:hypothetical protein